MGKPKTIQVIQVIQVIPVILGYKFRKYDTFVEKHGIQTRINIFYSVALLFSLN
jgi:hypothetical protein